MSTRCQIIHLGKSGTPYPVYIYKHCDGYPEGVMPTLAPFVKAFAADRGDDSEYFIAQCVRQFALADALEYEEQLRTTPPDQVKYLYDPATRFTGWGCCTGWHGDIEYLYIVAADGSIKIIEPRIPDDWPDAQIPDGTEVAWTPEEPAST